MVYYSIAFPRYVYPKRLVVRNIAGSRSRVYLRLCALATSERSVFEVPQLVVGFFQQLLDFLGKEFCPVAFLIGDSLETGRTRRLCSKMDLPDAHALLTHLWNALTFPYELEMLEALLGIE